jgi:hypothetical protein
MVWRPCKNVISGEFLASTGGNTHISLRWSTWVQGNVRLHASEVIFIIHAIKQSEWAREGLVHGVHAVLFIVVFLRSFLNAGVHFHSLHVVHVPGFPNVEVNPNLRR